MKVKTIGLILLGLIVWSAMVYAALSFLSLETNPLLWTKDTRGAMVFLIFVYVLGSILMMVGDEKSEKN